MAATFIFGGDTGETPDTLKRKRQVALALMQQDGTPRNVGEGLAAVGKALSGRFAMNYLDGQEKKGQESANAAFAPLAAMFSSGASSGVAQELGATAPGGSPAVAANPNVGSTIDFARAGASGASGAAPADVAGLEGYIRDAAQKRGIDPEIAVKVARSEGLAPGVWQSNVVKNGKRETSYGPYQLLVGGGLGDKFQKIYGKSPADPSTVQQQIDFALDEAAQGGWGPWYGAAKVGVGQRTGLERARALGYQQQAQPTEVASLDPSAGMTAPAAIEQQAPIQPPAQPGYVDPKVSAQPAAQPAQPPQQMAQAGGRGGIMDALMAGGAGGTGQGTDYFPPAPAAPQPGELNMQAILGVVNNPFSNPGQRAVAEALIQQEQAKRQAILEQQLKQKDPKYQLDLQKGQTELDMMRNPRMDPGEAARIELDREKFGYERNKPMSVSQGETIISPTGEEIYKSAPKPQAPTVQKLTLSDGSEVAVQWNQQTETWDPIKAPQGGSDITPKTKLTESQSKLTLFQNLQTETQPVLLDLESQFNPANLKDAAARSTPIAGNFFKSEQGQIYDSAATAWAEGALRIATGAAATTDEIERTKKAYFAQPGDSPITIAFKAQMRNMYDRSIQKALGSTTVDGTLPKPSEFVKQFSGEQAAPTEGASPPPGGIDQEVWDVMTPEEKALWK